MVVKDIEREDIEFICKVNMFRYLCVWVICVFILNWSSLFLVVKYFIMWKVVFLLKCLKFKYNVMFNDVFVLLMIFWIY